MELIKDPNKELPKNVKLLIEYHRDIIDKSQIHLLKLFKRNHLIEDKYVKYNDFYEKLLEGQKIKSNIIKKLTEIEKEQYPQWENQFKEFFCMDKVDHLNFVEYYYYLNKSVMKSKRAFIWGLSTNGKLGIDEADMIQKNKLLFCGGQLVNSNGNNNDSSSISRI